MGEEELKVSSLEIQKIRDIQVEDDKKAKLSFLSQSRTIAEFAAKFDCSYSYGYQTLNIWVAKGWIIKLKSRGSGGTKYTLDQNRVSY